MTLAIIMCTKPSICIRFFFSLIHNNCIGGKEVKLFHENEHIQDGNKLIFEQINNFLDAHLRKISRETPETDQDETVLSYYCNVWTRFYTASKTLNRAAKYLNHQYHKKDPESETVEQISIRIWRDHLFTHLNKKVSDAALRMLERHREGQWIDKTAIEAVIKSYIHIGILAFTEESDITTGHLTVNALKFTNKSQVCRLSETEIH